MFKTRLSIVALGVALAFGSIGAANALELTTGNYKISFDNYDSGTIGYGTFAPATFTQVCTTVAECDAVPPTGPAPGSNGSVNTSADTMGILSVSSIFNVTTGQTEFLKGTAGTVGGVAVGPYLTGIFGNLMDANVLVTCPPDSGACTTDARAVGGTFSLWSNGADFDPTNGPLVSGTTDLNDLLYPGISSGALFLSGVFAAGGAVGGDLVTTYASNFNNNSISGIGFGALDFTGGAALPFFDTNSYTNVNMLQNDAYLTASYNPSAAVPNWTVISTGQVIGELQVPEPGSLALVALALLGAAGASRRAKR